MSNRWDHRYARGEYGDKGPEPVLVQAADAVQPGLALDLACGLGRHSVWLANHGWQVTAVDYSDVALALLEQRAAGLNIHIVRADIEAGHFTIEPGAYDLICDCCFLWRPLFYPMREGLMPGGLFVGVYPVTGDSKRTSPTNPAYLLERAELLGFFHDWDILHYFEGRPDGDPARRVRAEIVARKPL